MSTDRYTSPLSERYASKEMQYIFSQDMKFSTWRKLWIALAETEMELGLSENGKPVITQDMIDEMKEHVNDINYDVAVAREKLVRHDVMSHVYAYGQQCPKAAGIIHLGATSCYVGDNTDIIIMNEALKLVHKKLVSVIAELSNFAEKYKDQPTLAFTHFQPAQPTTVGKRATLWTQEFLMDLEDLEYVQSTLKLLGSKGTTGTQASFLELFDGDQETIDKIDPMIAEKMGFKSCYPVSGQTYSRKVDTRVLNVLAGIAASAHKMSNDIRLLQHLKEVEEPFEKNQIGSSAMAYKRNPMRSERIASLSRYVMVDALNPAITSATQWFERTLDDSANKRLSVPEGFLAIDGILDLCLNVVDGLVVYPKVIYKHFMAEIPFMATENIMMDAVKECGNRQELHEKIRQLSMQAGKTVKEEGKDNNLVEVTLGYDDATGYEAGLGNAFGASVGRNANRIGGAVIEINGTEYHLTKNDGENNLHSGLDFYHGRMWKVADADDTHVTFEMDSPDGDQGYPGALVMKVTYSLDEENTLMIHYEAEPDQDTIINMTNHSYFNLNGHKSGDVLNHTLWLNADAFTPADAASIPTGEIRSVEGTPMDFRTDKTIGIDIEADYEPLVFGKGYDHNWVLKNEGEFDKVAEVAGDESGIHMSVLTDLPGVQIYTANFLDGVKGRDGAVYEMRDAICLETQYYPDAIHHENFPGPICKKGEKYDTRTAYRFRVK